MAGSLPIRTVPHWCEGVRLSKARDSTIGNPAFFSTAFSFATSSRWASQLVRVHFSTILSPSYRNTSIYQKSFGFNDFYLSDGAGGAPLGNVQLLGRVSGKILKANMPSVPEWLLERVSRHAIDFYAMSEDLPHPESRITVDGDRIVLKWTRTNWDAHLELVARLKAVLKKAGFPIVLSRAFDKRTPSHQCGTVRIGNDPATSPLDVYCRSFDHPNLFVVDASFLPTSAAVNPALTVAAQALRVADHIRSRELVA